MTDRQRITLMADLWPAACDAQGWKADDRALRLRILSQAVGRPLTSASEINNTTDFDKVKAHLSGLANQLPPVVKNETPGEDAAVRRRFKVREYLKYLAVYLDGGAAAAEKYLAAIIRDKFYQGSDAVHQPLPGIDDLDTAPVIAHTRAGVAYEKPSQLDQVLMTISRAVHEKRKAAGDTLHEMKNKAGLKCECRQCCPQIRLTMPISSPSTEPEKMHTAAIEQPF